ncbi:hypothetical protein DFH11DRAFT_1582958 [Phellopilus nigrolimitatus]|nr:hypothetical protein DFH11DRAFT_1582958 [Phellopilus nigrolimitatus]
MTVDSSSNIFSNSKTTHRRGEARQRAPVDSAKMSEDLCHLKQALEEVMHDLNRMADGPGAEIERIHKPVLELCNNWNQNTEKFDSIASGMHGVARAGAQCIEDFSSSFRRFLENKKATVQDKLKELQKFKEKLSEAFGPSTEKLYRLQARATELNHAIRLFEVRLKAYAPNIKEHIEQDHEALSKQIDQLDGKLDSGDIAAANRSSLPRGKELSDLRRRLKANDDEKTELRKHTKMWQTLTQKCCERIKTNEGRIALLVNTWITLSADTKALQEELRIMSEAEVTHEALFNDRVDALQEQYISLKDSFIAFMHSKKPSGGPFRKTFLRKRA